MQLRNRPSSKVEWGNVPSPCECGRRWPKDTGTVKVAVGLYDLTKKSPSHKTFGVERVLVHPQLNKPQQYDNDLALIRLDGKVDRGQLPPICLPPQDAAYDHGTKTMVVGWGRMGNGRVSITPSTTSVP
ncbi:hypothetical protein LAZ67_1005709 [Cordylochernes scorpioides]|uniref:Peptidase S1 domain-containing protein n=1 Tax=Cordylochernes scorpioides TaxID=51811 RepID=A0ABY6K1E1_9ARAC|nr:hypothetical protein LAZ67_1005709 [Cordylochernes scorpioides]